MNLARLRVFETVARIGTFAGAAEALSFTPSAISQQMGRLEAELGTVLLERNPRGIRLTPAGKALLTHAERILREVREAQTSLESLAGAQVGRLRLGTFPTATQTFVAHGLRAYRERHPGVDVHLREGEPHELARALADRELDLAVVFAWPGREIGLDYRQRFVCADDQIETVPLFDDPYVVVAPHGHRLAGRASVMLDELADEFVIGNRFTPGLDQVTAHFADLRRGPLFTGHALPDYQSVRALAAAGDGIGIIPRLAALNELAGTVTIPIAERVPLRAVLLAEPADAVRSPAGAAMIPVLEEAANTTGRIQLQ